MAVTLIVITVWIFSTCLHEFGHAITAYMAGDKTVKDKGYLTLNPMVYFNSVTTLIIPLFVLLIGGIPLPGAAVYINHTKIKSRIWLSLVSFAGPLFTFLFLLFLAVLINVISASPGIFPDRQTFSIVYSSIAFLIYLHIFVLILNLLPLPPLDGFGIIEPWLPKAVQRKARELSNLGFALLFVLFFMVDEFARFMSQISALGTVLLGTNLKGVSAGATAFEDSSKFLVIFLIGAWIIKGRFEAPSVKGDNELKRQNYEEAIKHYLEAREKNPEDTRLDLAIATCYLSLGKADQSHKYLDHALEKDPKDSKAIGLKAAVLSEEGRYQEASTLLETLEEGEEESMAFPFVVKASADLETGNFEAALVASDKALEIEPRNHGALQVKAMALTEMERYEEALVAFNSMARTKEGFNTACLLKGVLLISLDRKEEGFSEIKKMLSTNEEDRPDDIRNLKKIFMERAVELNQKGKVEEAERLKEAAKELSQTDPFKNADQK